MMLLRSTISCKTCICAYIHIYIHTHIYKTQKKITWEPKDITQMDRHYSCICLLHRQLINFYLWNQGNWLLSTETQYTKKQGKSTSSPWTRLAAVASWKRWGSVSRFTRWPSRYVPLLCRLEAAEVTPEFPGFVGHSGQWKQGRIPRLTYWPPVGSKEQIVFLTIWPNLYFSGWSYTKCK